ncbi:hypothetical protein VTL71DRAFT_12949 [Oculimacula yallundae]|uniref:BTB domain-containing protein n=1 Tax=Oculimacula yallundae TaxID=86028 RepID=A0ABR4CPF7_9HELO
MSAEKRTFDPDGDLLLQLSQPAKKRAKKQPREASFDEADPQTSSLPSAELGHNGDEAASPSGAESEDNDEESLLDVEINMLVSSKHMKLSSPVFRAMLQRDGFKEGQILEATGSVEIPLPDDDPEAMTILLDVVHGRNRMVPRKVTLKTLTAIAVLADKYQMVEVLEAFSNSWIKRLKPKLPTEYLEAEDELSIFRWLKISWVFSKAKEFKAMTRLMEQGGYSTMEQYAVGALAVPSIIIDAVMERREEALSECYLLIDQTIQRYQRSEVLCPRDDIHLAPACDALLLGSLLKSVSSLGLYPAPEAPYDGVSFDEVEALLSDLSVQALCDRIRPYMEGNEFIPAHGLKDVIQERIAGISERLAGLDLKEFKSQVIS